MITGNIRCIDSTANEIMYVTVDLTTACNKNCNFCVYRSEPGEGRYMNELTFDHLEAYLKDVIEHYDRTEILLFGGEPTLHPKLFEMCDRLRALNPTVLRLQSNLSQDVDFYLELSKHIDQLVLTLHVDDQDKPEVLNKLFSLEPIAASIEIFFMFCNDTIFDKMPLYDSVKARFYTELHHLKRNELDNILPQWKAYWQAEAKHYTLDHTIIQEDDGFRHDPVYEELFFDVRPEVSKNKCYAGKQSMYIDVDGIVYPCDIYKLEDRKPIHSVLCKYRPRQPFMCEGVTCSRDWCVRRES